VLLAAALGSGAVGFGVVWGVTAWAGQQAPAQPAAIASWDRDRPVEGRGRPDAAAVDAGTGQDDDHAAAGDAPPEVPPGPTPEGVAIDGAPLYLKCEDELGNVFKRKACGRLVVLEKRFATRLYVVDRCRRRVSGADAKGKLSLGIAVDFEDMSLGYWSGPSSDIAGAAQIAACLRDELAGLPLHGIDHPLVRYRMFQTVIFGVGEVLARGKGKSKIEQARVVMDRVRVREQPVDGAIIGRVSANSEVRLLESRDGWCRVVTPSSRVGWMTCDALDI